VLPNATDKRRWDFAAAADRRGWMPAQSVEERPGEGLAFVATDRDPWVASPGLQLRAAEVAAVRIRMRVHNPDYPVDAPVGQLFWLGEDDDALDEARCATFPVLNDGSMHEYRVEVARCPGWPSSGEVLFLRIDPVDGPAEIDVVEVVIEERG
jgi:hypothetical protein